VVAVLVQAYLLDQLLLQGKLNSAGAVANIYTEPGTCKDIPRISRVRVDVYSGDGCLQRETNLD
jgi:hypothetical protein